MEEFCFEGKLMERESNFAAQASAAALLQAAEAGTILEALCYKCDEAHNLYVKLGAMRGVIPHAEGAIGAAEGELKDIALISKVGKPVQFVVQSIQTGMAQPYALLSRREAQLRCRKEYVNALQAGDIIEAKITHLERFGAFADIGAGISALIPIDMLSVSRISHPRYRVRQGQIVRCAVRNTQGGKITLSLRELLGTWEENAANFRAGQTVQGIVRSVESYGVFIELAPNLAGLAEYNDCVHEGQWVSVFIKAMIPEKMKIKLSIIDDSEQEQPAPLQYFFEGEHMRYWRYSPSGCSKLIETDFDI